VTDRSTAAKVLEALGVGPTAVGELHRRTEDGSRARRDRNRFSRETKRVLERAPRDGEHRTGAVGTLDVGGERERP